jgi:hypothetical protein
MFWIVFGVPFLAGVFEWAVLGTRQRDQLRHSTAILAMTFSTASAFLGIWGLLHLEQMQHRAAFDYCFEGVGWLLATVALVATILWIVTKQKTWLSWLSLGISGWMFVIWALVCSTY